MKGFKGKIVIDGETLGGDIYYEKMLGFWLFMSCALSKSLIINDFNMDAKLKFILTRAFTNGHFFLYVGILL